MSRRRRRNFLEKLWSPYLWHRYAGLAAALFLIHLAITGIFLNHAHELELDRRFVSSDWLLDLYKIGPPDEIFGYKLADKWVTDGGRYIYLDDRAIAENGSKLVSAFLLADAMVVIVEHEILLFSPAGIQIERIPNPSPQGASIIAAGTSANGELVIAAGTRLLVADADLLNWSDAEETDFLPNKKYRLPEALRTRLAEKFRSTTLTWERVLQDVHSGRVAGNAGRLFFDIVALLLILLSGTGVIVWLQRLAAQRERDC
ncbi:MAG: PepSY-associated TM helix domain-containing protein [Gammaproteobacteria bacterium]